MHNRCTVNNYGGGEEGGGQNNWKNNKCNHRMEAGELGCNGSDPCQADKRLPYHF